MFRNPVLQKGLTKLKNSVKGRKDTLLGHFKRGEKILDENEEWLDNTGNLVDEEAVVDLLESASDYENCLAQLNSQQKACVKKLEKLGGKVNKVVFISILAKMIVTFSKFFAFSQHQKVKSPQCFEIFLKKGENLISSKKA